MKSTLLIYPVSLFENNDLINIENLTDIYILEDPVYFTTLKFHKMKLVLHRASCKYYESYLKNKTKKKIIYVDYHKINDKFYRELFKKYDSINLYDPVDHNIIDKLYKYTTKTNELNVYDTLAFPESIEDIDNYAKTVKSNNYTHDSSWYRWQRRRMNLLVTSKGEPLYGKWSFDKENRSPFDKSYKEPKLPTINTSSYVKEAINYVKKHFSGNFGSTENFIYPVTHEQASKLLTNFIKNRLLTFGKYEDAVSQKIIIGSHSFLSSSLNIGLITPEYVIEKVMNFFNKLSTDSKKKYIASVEAFIRQIIGWRSYVRMIYELHGREISKMNFMKNNYKLNNKWFEGETKIPPIDFIIKKVYNYAYFHHIERLMFIGNFCLLTGLHPIEVFKWYMIVSIDSYDWVMYPNIHGMSQYALTKFSIMTRPYFSSSNYLKKMSDFKDNKIEINKQEINWMQLWDALYYNFIDKHFSIVRKNYSTANAAILWKKKPKNEQNKHINLAKLYLKYLH